MSVIDILLIITVVAYCGYIIFSKKKRGCCGNCAKCRGCTCKEK